MNNKYIGVIDQGTSSTKFSLISIHGTIIEFINKEHSQIYPNTGWCEHDPIAIYNICNELIYSILLKEQYNISSIVCIGITNQRETTILWDKYTGIPVYNAIVWSDIRTEYIIKDIKQKYTKEIIDMIYYTTGCPLTTYFSLTKILWLFENITGLKERCKNGEILFGTMDSWIVWKLTGKHITDVTNASRTMLMSLDTLNWDKKILDLFDIPYIILPEIKTCSEIYGYGLSNTAIHKIPVSGNIGDQQAALFGNLCFNEGDIKNTFGTGSFMMVNTGNKIIRSQHGLVTTIGYQLNKIDNPIYALEGVISTAGSLIQWLRDNLGIIKNFNEIESLASEITDTNELIIVPAFSGLFSPHWDPTARGIFIGLTSHADKRHIALAAIQAIAYQVYELYESILEDVVDKIIIRPLNADGGLTKSNILMQFQCDLINEKMYQLSATKETTTLGAAYCAGLAVGYWKDIDSLKETVYSDRKIWEPSMKYEKRIHLISKWKEAVNRCKNWCVDSH